MSEYQYYEFRAIDRPLSEEQMDELSGWSSRAEITPRSFTNVYHYGNFRGDPEKLVPEYFDAFLYLANWGTRELIFRFPKKLLPSAMTGEYITGDIFNAWEQGDYVMLSFHSEMEEHEWGEGEGEGWMEELMQVREGLMRGDYRALYLGWLLGATIGDIDDDDEEPPVPAGLGELDAPLQALAAFLRIDIDLIAAAATQSPELPESALSEAELGKWLTGLAESKKDEILMSLLNGDEPRLATQLRQEALSATHGPAPEASASQRTAGELLKRSESLMFSRLHKEAAQETHEREEKARKAAKKRKAHLDSLMGKEEALWMSIRNLIKMGQAKPYGEAVIHLQDLRDLAEREGNQGEFSSQMEALHSEHSKKRGLVKRFREAKLIQ